MKHYQLLPFSQDDRPKPWTLYVIRLNNNDYYIGITSRQDFMTRINQHGTLEGAKVNLGKTVKEIMEIHPLGLMTWSQAGRIENEMMLYYRHQYGARHVRGGYEIYKQTSIIPAYTPGSKQSYILIIGCLIFAVLLLLLIIKI